MRIRLRSHAALILAAILCMTSILSVPTAMAGYATLRYGDSGDAVRAMQQALIDLGYDPGGVDGKFGRGTENAVKQFQRAKGLTADGLAGNLTLTALYGAGSESGTGSTAAPISTPAPTPAGASGGSSSGTYATLRNGDSGSAVKAMQQALISLGYAPGAADGKFGRGTQTAVKQFQKNNGLTVDGLAGNRTLTLLYGQAASGEATAPPATDSATATPTPTPTSVPTATPAPAATSGTNIPTRTLRGGYTGEDVRWVQQKLADLGYYSGGINGTYDNATAAAVKAFQGNNGLTSDGLAGAKTYAVLFGENPNKAGESTPTPTPSYSTLKLNSTGEAVTKLQQALKDLGYEAAVTGTYTTETRSAVVQFQLLNDLTADGVAGQKTQLVLYGGSAKNASTPLPALEEGAGIIDGPAKSEVQLLHWYNDVKPSIRSGQQILVFDPATKRSWTLRLYSLGHHADSEPLTLRDTQIMYLAFGGKVTWTPKPVYVRLPDGRWTVATTHDVAHLSGSILGNGFDGHLCVHFLRDMSECEKNDPDYGVTNQKAIRAAWKELTGITYVETDQ